MRGWTKVLGGIAIAVAILLIAALVMQYVRASGEDATELVRRAADAMDAVAVRGTVVTIVRTPQGPREVRAEMHRGEGRFSMRLLSGPGEGTRVFRREDAVWVEQDGERVARRASVGEERVRRELLERNWTFTTAGTRRIAGRTTTFVRGVGAGGSIMLAIDRETDFPLHISRRDRQGELLSETTWVNADFAVRPPEVPDPPAPLEERQRRRVSLEEARAAVDFEVFEPRWLPEGWELQGWFLNERPQGMMVQGRFSDGLRSMIIIQRSAQEIRERARQLQERRGEGERPPRPVQEDERERTERPDRAETPERAERDDRPERPDRPERRWDDQQTPSHLRGAGADASRRLIDSTLVIVSGPVTDETRERVLQSMGDAN